MVVTGGSRGIGAAIVAALASAGDRIIVWDVVEPDEAMTQRLEFQLCDVGDAESVSDAADALAKGMGSESVAALVNNAALNIPGAVDTIGLPDWQRVIATNVTGTFLVCQALVPYLKSPGGVIVNVGSDQTVIAKPQRIAYATSKGALLQFTRSLAVDLGPRGIRAVCVSPGPVESPMLAASGGLSDAAAARQSIPRPGHPDEIASVVQFVCSPGAAFITAANILVDGGRTAG